MSELHPLDPVTADEIRTAVALVAAYQNTGYRRVKNPRIWSMHDLHVLVGGPR